MSIFKPPSHVWLPGHFQRRLADIDASMQTGPVHVWNLLLDDVHRYFGCVHKNAASGPSAPSMDFFGHGQDYFGTGRLLCGVGEIALEKFLAVPISEHRARVDKSCRMWREAKKFFRRTAHRLKIDHLDSEQRRASAEP